ncbi:response regulator [Geodermatophilus sabuli]|uniref:Two component transcriptional regulator, LuxR family n=1 Tax=Geodermatophilus sabuli TaxID=1564158 RepID=A0A285EMF2_9ACTN|nr:response regulator transcription factor [Geodermatophilus sabuli]MBB3083730.1 DNA-binding NarL/FixJ family response regulator [Geodermatophilus sabuli]SNX99161.1 two component transcriptional regulator, LuxR family [Geodermatophilus sabuli]
MSGGPDTGVIGVLLVDDHAIVRRGVQAYVASVPTLRVLGEAADGQQAVELLHQWQTTGEPLPDVVLMDLQMPRMDGVAATAAIARAHPGVKVVILTSFGEVERVHAALAAGAAGYVLKDADPAEVATAITAAAAGEVHLDSAVARQLARRMAAPQAGLTSLTSREREILALVAQGHSNRDIADRLVISERTARTHVSNVLSKLQLSSRTQAALLAIREGLISPPA